MPTTEPDPNRYRPCTGQEIKNFVQASQMGIPLNARGWNTKEEVEAFLRSKGVSL